MFSKQFLAIMASVSAAAAAANFDAGANTNMAVYWVRGISSCLTPILTESPGSRSWPTTTGTFLRRLKYRHHSHCLFERLPRPSQRGLSRYQLWQSVWLGDIQEQGRLGQSAAFQLPPDWPRHQGLPGHGQETAAFSWRSHSHGPINQ